MPAKRYKVTLTQEERTFLEQLVSKGKAAAKKLVHARILLIADQNHGNQVWSEQQISEVLNVSVSTIERVRKLFVEEGVETALNRQKHSRCGHHKFDGDKEAHLIALACSSPPSGEAKWTTQLLADQMVELNHLENISNETIRQVLKKTNLNLG